MLRLRPVLPAPLTDEQMQKAERILLNYHEAVLMVRFWRSELSALPSGAFNTERDSLWAEPLVLSPNAEKARQLLQAELLQWVDQRTHWVWKAYQHVRYPAHEVLGWLYFNQPVVREEAAATYLRVSLKTFLLWKQEALAQFVKRLPTWWEDSDHWFAWDLFGGDDSAGSNGSRP